MLHHDSPQQAHVPYTGGGWLMPLSTSDRSVMEPAIRRLSALRPLSAEARASLEYAMLEGLQRAGSGEDLLSEGDPVDSVRIVLSGWLCRYKTLEDGRRQIVNFVFPGESCDAHAFLLSVMDHSIATLTPAVYAEIKRGRFESLEREFGSVHSRHPLKRPPSVAPNCSTIARTAGSTCSSVKVAPSFWKVRRTAMLFSPWASAPGATTAPSRNGCGR